MKMMTSATIALTTLTATLLAVGCGSDASEMQTPTTEEVTGTAAQKLTGDRAVTVYDDSQYLGFLENLGPGYYDWGQIHNDTISSLRVPVGMQAWLYSDTHFSGQSVAVTQDTPWIGYEWNDRVSSIIVVEPSHWSCFTYDGRYRGDVSIDWGDNPNTAAWTCNSSFSDCGNNGGCRAVGGIGDLGRLNTRMDGCSIPLPDPASDYYKEVFRNACNYHDLCYHAPWDTIGGDGFDTCNTNLVLDMFNACAYEVFQLPCFAAIDAWASAMNYDPTRTIFWNSFGNDQGWVRNSCWQ